MNIVGASIIYRICTALGPQKLFVKHLKFPWCSSPLCHRFWFFKETCFVCHNSLYPISKSTPFISVYCWSGLQCAYRFFKITAKIPNECNVEQHDWCISDIMRMNRYFSSINAIYYKLHWGQIRCQQHVQNWLQPNKDGKAHSVIARHLVDFGNRTDIRHAFKIIYQPKSK